MLILNFNTWKTKKIIVLSGRMYNVLLNQMCYQYWVTDVDPFILFYIV